MVQSLVRRLFWTYGGRWSRDERSFPHQVDLGGKNGSSIGCAYQALRRSRVQNIHFVFWQSDINSNLQVRASIIKAVCEFEKWRQRNLFHTCIQLQLATLGTSLLLQPEVPIPNISKSLTSDVRQPIIPKENPIRYRRHDGISRFHVVKNLAAPSRNGTSAHRSTS